MFTQGFYEIYSNYKGDFCVSEDYFVEEFSNDCIKSDATIFSCINRKDASDIVKVDTTLNMGTAFCMIILL